MTNGDDGFKWTEMTFLSGSVTGCCETLIVPSHSGMFGWRGWMRRRKLKRLVMSKRSLPFWSDDIKMEWKIKNGYLWLGGKEPGGLHTDSEYLKTTIILKSRISQLGDELEGRNVPKVLHSNRSGSGPPVWTSYGNNKPEGSSESHCNHMIPGLFKHLGCTGIVLHLEEPSHDDLHDISLKFMWMWWLKWIKTNNRAQ